MFSKLKDKLKEALSIFSRKTEEEVKPKEEVSKIKEEKVVEQKKERKIIEPKKEEKKLPPEEKKKEITTRTPEKGVKEKIKGLKLTYFVHGTTKDNEKGLSTGWNQGELSELGQKQSLQLRDLIGEQKFDLIFCSDLKRAVDSAKLIFPKDQYKIRLDKRLRECNYGELNGQEEKKVKSSLLERIDVPFPQGESYREVEKRVADFLHEIWKTYSGKHLAIVAHQAPQLALEVLLKGKTWEQAIKEDWRLTKKWQPGWVYWMENEVEPTKAEKKIVEEKIPEKEPEKKGFFTKIKETFTTRTISTEKFEELFWELELALLENNVSVEVMEKIKEDLKKELVEKPLPLDISGKILQTLKQTLTEIVSFEKVDLLQRIKQKKNQPFIIAFFGINGSGKTTSIAKLTRYLQKKNLSLVLAASDTFRAAAIQQLEEHANKLGVKMIKHDYGADAAAVAFDAVKYAEKNKIDVVLIDTAGRLHSNTNLMAELEKIIRVTHPDFKIFVGESLTGNDCIEQARRFNKLVDLDGVILTKADVDEKGGAPLSIAYTIKKPILFLGVGQKYEDLEEFKAEVILEKLGL